MRTCTFVLLGCLLLPRLSLAGGLPVFDAALNTLGIQEQWVQLKELYESMQHTANQIKQLENQVRQITGMYTQIDQGVRNLAALDVTNLTDLYGLLHQLESKLQQAEYIGYQAQSAPEPGPALYPRIQGVLTAEQQRTLNLQWAAMRRNAAQVAISTQAIREAQARYQQQWADLLSRRRRQKGHSRFSKRRCRPRACSGINSWRSSSNSPRRPANAASRRWKRRPGPRWSSTSWKRPWTPGRTYVPQGRLLPMPRTGRE